MQGLRREGQAARGESADARVQVRVRRNNLRKRPLRQRLIDTAYPVHQTIHAGHDV